MTKEELKTVLGQRLETAEKWIDGWFHDIKGGGIDDLMTNLENEHVFKHAARVKVCARILKALRGKDVTPETLRDWLLREVTNASMSPPSSTSPTSNLMKLQLNAAYAEVLGIICGNVIV